MKKRLLNDKWLFIKSDLNAKADDVLQNKGGFMKVCIPHDHLIFDGKNLYEDCIGWYLRRLSVQELKNSSLNYEEGEKVFLWFDGVYMDSAVYIDGEEVFQWKYGYSSFYVDITEYMNRESLDILVKAVNQSPNSRWYSGSGIFRDVYLYTSKEKYIPFGGTYFHSEKIQDSDDYRIFISSEVVLADENTSVEFIITDENNIESRFSYDSCSKTDGKTVFSIESIFKTPYEWDTDNPKFYKLKTCVIDNGVCVDEHLETIGFKDLKFTTDKGLFLNGRHIKLNGVCEHHDFGCLGAAFYEDALIRKFTLLKKMGVNSVRTSHNMPASLFMDVADRMGILVLSEAFDMWERPKTEYDYARFFNDWVEKDVESWIRRDRNHPSLLMWSIGNEIQDTHAGERGYEITQQLMDLVKSHDPLCNGKITLGSNYMPWENTQKCADLYKLVGYNYAARYYDDHHEKYNDWVIYGSETASIVMSRGIYHFPFSQPVLSDDDEQCSALGNSTTSWGAKSVESCISEDRDVEFSLGQYLWTGFDYIGEPTPYHTRNSYFGQLDTAGFPKDSYYVFMAEWTDAKTNPMVHIFPYWDFSEGQLIDIRACSNGASIELFVNGESKGRKELNHRKGADFTATWQVPYTKGEITAVAYNSEGKEIKRETRKSFGNPEKLVAISDKKEILANGRSLAFVEISAVDGNGNPVENAMNYVDVSVDGPGYLVGLDNGDSTDYDEYKCSRRKLFSGKLLAVILCGEEEGTITVKAEACGLKFSEIKIEAIAAEHIEGVPDKETLDFENERILSGKVVTDRVPARKLEIKILSETNYDDGIVLNKDNNSCEFEAVLYPENTTDTEIEFRAVNAAGIDVDYIEVIQNENKVSVKALGDGEFYLRALSKDSEGKVRLISHIELSARDIGQAYMNPYKFVTGGLYTEEFGGVGNGNDKGFATSNDGKSGVIFRNVDFGPVGSDEITLPIFTFSNDPYPFKLYVGDPIGSLDGESLDKTLNDSLFYEGVYQKNYIWNVYQEETFKLPRRIKGLCDIGISLETKVHIKGFEFKKYEKAYEKLYAAECDRVYGDKFTKNENSVTDIGNNVTLEFKDMDFSEKGINRIYISGKTPLNQNTIHIKFTDSKGNDSIQIIEFKHCDDYECQVFDIEPVESKCDVHFVFLPGSQFDFEYFWFE